MFIPYEQCIIKVIGIITNMSLRQSRNYYGRKELKLILFTTLSLNSNIVYSQMDVFKLK